ncbi:MAG: AAA family ATPase [Candidatus Pacearchaeota archaeon]|nr:AAA family ATPase [Candidatus Pacearchaeota archaeon]
MVKEKELKKLKLTFKPCVLGVSGTIASGKDFVADYIAKSYGFKKITLSDYLRAEAIKRGKKPSRDYLRKLQAELRKEYGDDYLILKVIETILKKDHMRMKNIVIVGLRTPLETKLAKEKLKAKLIFVDANPFVRYIRQKKRHRTSGFSKTYEQFLHEEALENAAFDFHKVKKMVDFELDNSGTIDEMKKRVDIIMRKLKVKKLKLRKRK